MSWLLSFVVAFLTGLAGMVVSGFVANMAVQWYRISSFEGGSGYFVVGMALLGLIGGGIIGLVTARTMAPADPGFLRVLATSLAVTLLLTGSIGGISRLLADVPPTIDDEELLLAFELRWPGHETRAPSDFVGLGFAKLGSASGQTMRTVGDGALFTDLAHQVEGRWVIPGAVEIFTARGTRVLDVGFGDSTLAGFILPLPGHPGEKERQWSEWLPRARAGDPPLPDQYSYRYRVVKLSEAVRHDSVAPFDVATSVSGFFNTSDTKEKSATSEFRVTYHGAPIDGIDAVGAIALVANARPALLLREGGANGTGACHLLTEEGGQAHLTALGECGTQVTGDLLTSDSAAWNAWRENSAPRGWLDRRSFRIPGLYRLDHGILDTRTLTFTEAEHPSEPTPIGGLRPVLLSPDEQSYVWFAHDGGEDKPVLCVTNWKEQSTYLVPIDRSRMRYNEHDRIDPAWVLHHFTWTRNADGATRLTPRTDFVPFPYRGDREIDFQGAMTSYYLRPGGTDLRNAMVEAMVSELGAQRMPDELNGYHQVVKFEGKLIKAGVVESAGFISIGMDYGTIDSALMTRLADRLDALLATGKYDAFFHLDPKPEQE